MDDKKVILSELNRLVNKLQTRGVSTEGLFYGVKNLEIKDDDESKIQWRADDEFIKVFPKELSAIASELTGTELMIVITLMNCMSYTDGLLKKGGGYPVDMTYIEMITGFTKKTVIKAMGNLVRKRVYFYGRTGIKQTDPYQFYANPYIFFKGKYINPTLISMFKDYKGMVSI